MGTAVDRAYQHLTLPTLVEIFLADKRVEGKAVRTLDWYRERLDRFCDFLGRDAPPTLADITVQHARGFVAELQARTDQPTSDGARQRRRGRLSPHTLHGYVRALKVFSNWLHEEGYTTTPVFGRLKTPQLPDVMIEILSDDEIERILNAISTRSALGMRLQTIVLLLLDTGIRASELCTLTLENTEFETGYIKVLGKGNKERLVPFGITTKKALLRYIHGFRLEPACEDITEVFLSRNGTPLTYNGLRLVIKRLGKSAGVPRLHAHLFRHSFAVRYLMNGGDIMTLKLMLGHTTLEVTQMYLHLAEAHVQVQHNRFSPVDRLGLGRRRQTSRR